MHGVCLYAELHTQSQQHSSRLVHWADADRLSVEVVGHDRLTGAFGRQSIGSAHCRNCWLLGQVLASRRLQSYGVSAGVI